MDSTSSSTRNVSHRSINIELQSPSSSPSKQDDFGKKVGDGVDDNNCTAIDLLNKHNVNIYKIKEEIKSSIKRSSELDNVFELTNLNQKAYKKQPLLIHREQEINSLIEILLRKQKPNALILGDPGVGKTSIVYHLASLINKGKVSEKLKNKVP